MGNGVVISHFFLLFSFFDTKNEQFGLWLGVNLGQSLGALGGFAWHAHGGTTPGVGLHFPSLLVLLPPFFFRRVSPFFLFIVSYLINRRPGLLLSSLSLLRA